MQFDWSSYVLGIETAFLAAAAVAAVVCLTGLGVKLCKKALEIADERAYWRSRGGE